MKRAISVLLLSLLPVFQATAEDVSLNTVVIDAGHGGHDPGAVSKDRKTYEKNLTLDIASRLSTLIQDGFPEVSVISTRPDDKYVTLNDRAVSANKAGAKLFISIHINSAVSTAPNGFSIHILGQSSKKDRDLFAYNMDVCKRENSVILLEDDYSTKYEGFDPSDTESQIFMMLMQNAYLEQSLKFAQIVGKKLKSGPINADRGIWQDPFYVLWKTAMPAVLVELGFISNDNDLKALRSAEKRDEIAHKLFEAFSEYKKSYDSSVLPAAEPKAEKKTEQAAAARTDNNARTVKDQKIGNKTEPVAKAKSEETEKKAPADDFAAKAEGSEDLYGVQIFVTSRRFAEGAPEFMGYKSRELAVGNLYKYIIAVSASREDVIKEVEKIRKKYPDCFLVKISGNEIKRVK